MAKPKQSENVYGFSLHATHIAAVALNKKTYELQETLIYRLPQGLLSENGEEILHAPELVDCLIEIRNALGNPEFGAPAYLCLPGTFAMSFDIVEQDLPVLNANLIQSLRQQQLIHDFHPLIQSVRVAQYEESATLAHAVINGNLLQEWIGIFYDAGIRVAGVDAQPLATLRALAGSGVLDALLKRIGTESVWGCFGVLDNQIWLSLWYGSMMIIVKSLTMPISQESLEATLQEFPRSVGIEKPVLWLAQPAIDPDLLPFDVLLLKLGVPIRQVVLGPIYQRHPHGKPVPSALGAALIEDVSYPFGWHFSGDPGLQGLLAQYNQVPKSNYQPVFPGLFAGLGTLAFIAVLGAGLYFLLMSAQAGQSQKAQLKQLQENLSTQQTQSNQLYAPFFAWIANGASGVQFKMVTVGQNKPFRIEGNSYKYESITQFSDTLKKTRAASASPVTFDVTSQKAQPSDGKPPIFRFVISGTVKSGKTGQPSEGKTP